jgi:Uncharacterized conserved protein
MRLAVIGLCLLMGTPEALYPKVGDQGRKQGRPQGGAAPSGVKTPGVRIPASDLKAEAEIRLSGSLDGILGGATVWITNPKENRLDRIDAKAATAGDAITGLSHPCTAPVLGFGSLWVLNCGDKTLSRVDPKTGKITSIPTGAGSSKTTIAVSSDSVWVLTDERTTLSRVDPADNKIVAEVRLPAGCNALAFGESAVWVTCPAEDKTLKIDPQTNTITSRIDVAAGPQFVAVGEGAVWVWCQTAGKLERIDPKTNKVVKTIDLGAPGFPGEIAIGDGSVWVSTPGLPISRIDPATDSVAQQFVGEGGGGIAFGAGFLWLVNADQRTVWKIDPKRVLATLAY